MKYKQMQGGIADVLLSRLANVKNSGTGWMASCPAHGGHDCLTINEKDGRVLVHCFAGCDTRDVVEAVDLRLSDLFADSLNPQKRREYQPRRVDLESVYEPYCELTLVGATLI